ncbi:MAG: HupE/UreJ family protein [Verrucomicrobia bacterium]|nr:HupE/UreJ family protein [Verrucomicrobiota bacterium]
MKFVVFILASLLLPLTASAHGISDAHKQGILAGGNLEYLRLGAIHMLTGYDHLLFLFGVMFFLTRFGDIVKFITAFTLGHCVTLVFATLFHIQADFYLIDSIIALTVCYKAFDNLDGFKQYLGVEAPNLLGAVTLFGLIHGFGLSTRLQQLPLGHDGLVLRILSFNVGVEVGQILALSGMWVFLAGWRKTSSFTKFSKVANVLLMFAGVLLLLMQLHGYQHSRYSDDFPLNKDEHYHLHQDMNRSRDPEPQPVAAGETSPQNQSEPQTTKQKQP